NRPAEDESVWRGRQRPGRQDGGRVAKLTVRKLRNQPTCVTSGCELFSSLNQIMSCGKSSHVRYLSSPHSPPPQRNCTNIINPNQPPPPSALPARCYVVVA